MLPLDCTTTLPDEAKASGRRSANACGPQALKLMYLSSYTSIAMALDTIGTASRDARSRAARRINTSRINAQGQSGGVVEWRGRFAIVTVGFIVSQIVLAHLTS